MKKIITIILIFLFAASPVRASDVASGISEFIYGMFYLSIGTTSCKEIVDKAGKEGEEAFSGQINQLINTANTMAGKETVNRDVVEGYAQDLYNYCQEYPEELFAKALAIVTRPLFNNESMFSSANNRLNRNLDKDRDGDNPQSIQEQSSVQQNDHRVSGATGAKRGSSPLIIN